MANDNQNWPRQGKASDLTSDRVTPPQKKVIYCFIKGMFIFSFVKPSIYYHSLIWEYICNISSFLFITITSAAFSFVFAFFFIIGQDPSNMQLASWRCHDNFLHGSILLLFEGCDLWPYGTHPFLLCGVSLRRAPGRGWVSIGSCLVTVSPSSLLSADTWSHTAYCWPDVQTHLQLSWHETFCLNKYWNRTAVCYSV